MPVPSRTPDHQISWPGTSGVASALPLTGGATLQGTVYLSGSSIVSTGDAATDVEPSPLGIYKVADRFYGSVELVINANLDTDGSAVVAAIWLIGSSSASSTPAPYGVTVHGVDNGFGLRTWQLFMDSPGADGVIDLESAPSSIHAVLTPDGITVGCNGADLETFDYSYDFPPVDYAPTSLGPGKIVFWSGASSSITAARWWMSETPEEPDPPDPPAITAMWNLRQRQTLSGNAGGWPLRQRQNGGHTGSWNLRQRQTGI